MRVSSPSLRFAAGQGKRPWWVLGLLMAMASIAHGQDSTSEDELAADLAAIAAHLAELRAPQGPSGPKGPTGEDGPAGPTGEDGLPLSQAQIVELAERTAELEKRALHARLRLEQLDTTLAALHAVTEKLSADADTLDRLQQTGGLGSIGQLLRQAGATLPEAQVQVLGPDNGGAYLASRAIDDHHPFVLDLTHEVQQHLSHGLTLTMTRSQSGLKALASVLERWVLHTQGVRVHITPEPRVDDRGGHCPGSSAVVLDDRHP